MTQHIKDIGNSWLQSLKILSPKQGKLFFLVTLKSILESYRILFFKFWWLFLLCVIVDFLYVNYTLPPNIGAVVYCSWFLLWCLLGFVTFLTIRPSLELKNYRYYGIYFWHFIMFVLYTLCARTIWHLIIEGFHNWVFLVPALAASLMTYMFFSPAVIPTVYVSPFLMVLILFSLDSKNNFYWQLKRVPLLTLKMIIYNYPFFFIIAQCASFTWFIAHDLIKVIMHYAMTIPIISFILTMNAVSVIANDFAKLVLPVFFCFVANYYIKEVHEQFKRYF